jgi:hypothetical protein
MIPSLTPTVADPAHVVWAYKISADGKTSIGLYGSLLVRILVKLMWWVATNPKKCAIAFGNSEAEISELVAAK